MHWFMDCLVLLAKMFCKLDLASPKKKCFNDLSVILESYYSPFTNCWTSQSNNLLIFRCFTAYHVVKKLTLFNPLTLFNLEAQLSYL